MEEELWDCGNEAVEFGFKNNRKERCEAEDHLKIKF